MDHQRYMLRAIALSLLGLGRTRPNPIVGAVVVDSSGLIVGEGFHVGKEHAEVLALEATQVPLEDCTLYVSLEPCNHYGKTPPCTRAIIDSGIRRVVFAMNDPNLVAIGGAQVLRDAGIEVISDLCATASAWANRAWLHKISKGRPYFIWKIASTIDGFTAAADGTSQWITGIQARQDGHSLRAQSDAILIGTGTAIADNPSLLPHLIDDDRRPVRYVMGKRTLPSQSQLLSDGYTTRLITSHSFAQLLDDLNDLGANQVLIESGSVLGTALMQEGLIDEIVLYQAPSIIGSGTRAIGDLGISTISAAPRWHFSQIETLGRDLKVVLTQIDEMFGA
ncbi:MAG: bifunctional diaminohydroxyphosphoribosylaminopyrimidine deaminase/5-amino-6-(5-phosphoribosylamino)uracil reductase RibD [Actinomycetota bacterium]